MFQIKGFDLSCVPKNVFNLSSAPNKRIFLVLKIMGVDLHRVAKRRFDPPCVANNRIRSSLCCKKGDLISNVFEDGN